MTSLTIPSRHRSPSEAPSQITAKSLGSPWRWAVVACLLLGISGGFRFWRERQFATLAAENNFPPFPLKDLPRTLGDWRSEASMDGRLEAEVARVAGSSDYIIRTYLNEKSGDQITALVLYGLADRIFGHSPDACYPAAGHERVAGPVDRELKVPGLEHPVRYRWAIYMKRTGGIRSYEEACHTFYYNGEWMPNASNQWKLFRYQPAMFKVQLGRPVSGWSDEAPGPSEEMLGALVQEIRSRVTRAAQVDKGTPSTKSSAPDSIPPRGTDAG